VYVFRQNSADVVQVQILENPSSEELGRKLEKLRPDILMLHGEQSFERDEIGGLVVRDGKAISSESLSPLLSVKAPELVSCAFYLPFHICSFFR